MNITCSSEPTTQQMGSFSMVHAIMNIMEELSKELIQQHCLQPLHPFNSFPPFFLLEVLIPLLQKLLHWHCLELISDLSHGSHSGDLLESARAEKLWQVALYKKIGTKSQERSETVTQPPQTAPHRALQSLSLWKHILIVQGCGVQLSCLLFLLPRHCH